MPEKPKHDGEEKKDTWSEDQKEHEYYYDDAHGYEEYDPEEERVEEDAETGKSGDAEKDS